MTQCMTYGEMPDREEFVAHVTPQLEEHGNDYPMTLKQQSEWTALAEAVNQGIDSYLEIVEVDADSSTGKVEVHGAKSLHTLLRRLSEQDTDEGPDLASSILYTLGYDWI